jgi:hypothetical protein
MLLLQFGFNPTTSFNKADSRGMTNAKAQISNDKFGNSDFGFHLNFGF